jgi:hypothetical protein
MYLDYKGAGRVGALMKSSRLALLVPRSEVGAYATPLKKLSSGVDFSSLFPRKTDFPRNSPIYSGVSAD